MKKIKKIRLVRGFRAWIRLRGMRKHKKKLESFWEELIRNIREFLKRDDLVFNDFYELLDSVETLFKEIDDEPIENEFWQRCFGLATIDDSVDMIKYKGEYSAGKAWQEIEKIIQEGHLRKDATEEALMRIMRENVNESSRIRALKLFKQIGPSSEKLSELRKLPFVYSSPSLSKEIEAILKKEKKRKKRKPQEKIIQIQQIQETIEKINKLKKGQE